MIRYRLKCLKDHEFEAWFRNGDAFDRQARRGQVACPACGSTRVEKALMAPGVITSKSVAGKDPGPPAAVPAPTSPPQARQVANMSQRELVQMMRALRDEVVKKSEYVGPRFAEEARKIHNEETEARGIYGEASPREVTELVDEGVDIYPLPVLPEDHN